MPGGSSGFVPASVAVGSTAGGAAAAAEGGGGEARAASAGCGVRGKEVTDTRRQQNQLKLAATTTKTSMTNEHSLSSGHTN